MMLRSGTQALPGFQERGRYLFQETAFTVGLTAERLTNAGHLLAAHPEPLTGHRYRRAGVKPTNDRGGRGISRTVNPSSGLIR